MRRLISAATYRRVAWNNGGGTTDDIDVVDAAGKMVWRLSVAAVERSGPFSDFSGYDRTILALSGDAFSLDVSGAAVVIDRLFIPFRFDGGRSTACRLFGAPVRVLNVMTERASHTHELTICRLPATLSPVAGTRESATRVQMYARYIVALQGETRATWRRTSQAVRILPGDTLRVDGEDLLQDDTRLTSANSDAVVAAIAISRQRM